MINEVEKLAKKRMLTELFLEAFKRAELEFAERRLKQPVQESVNKSGEISLEDRDLGPGDFTAEQLSEARRLFLYEGYTDADALQKVRRDQDG